jgi:hypothetical protein
MTAQRALIKAAAGLGAAAVLATAVIGVAHTPWGRPLLQLPLLRAMASQAGCPLGSVEPAEFERVRRLKLRADTGSATAGSHPALGFVLGATVRDDVERWAKRTGTSCKPDLVSSVLQCENVTALGAPAISQLRLQFDPQLRLVTVDAFRPSASPVELIARFETLARELDASVGPATSTVGTPSAAFVKSAPLQTVARSYRYRDYVATSMLLNFGKRGVRLREQYRWLAPEPPPA